MSNDALSHHDGGASTTANHTFTCEGSDPDAVTDFKIARTGTTVTVLAKFQNTAGEEFFPGNVDPTYRPTAANVEMVRIKWTRDDPWQDSGWSWLLVHKDVLDGKKGQVRFQVSGEAFENATSVCTPVTH